MSTLRPKIALSFALAALGLAGTAHALPSIQDYWRISCTGEPVSEKTLAKAQAKSDSGAGKLAYACQLSAMESKRHEAAMVKFAEGGSKGAAPVVNRNGSMAVVKQVAAQLEAQTKQKKDPKNMYYLGLALALQGDDWAVNKFDEVARGDSDYAGDAELGMAEFYFDKKGAAASVDQYKKVLKQKNKFNNAYARYKMAWINYAFGAQGKNRAQQKSAITQLASLSASLKKAKGPEASLARVLKDDILALCVDYGDQADAQRILQSVGAAPL